MIYRTQCWTMAGAISTEKHPTAGKNIPIGQIQRAAPGKWSIMTATVNSAMGKKMQALDAEMQIGASAEDVWSVLTDFNAYPQWNPFLISIKGELRKDSVLELEIRVGDTSRRTVRAMVLAADRPSLMIWRGSWMASRILEGEFRFVIEPLSEDTVRVRHREQFRGVLVPFLRGTLDGAFRRGFAEMNVALKDRAEASFRAHRVGVQVFDRDARCVITKAVGMDAAGRPILGESIEEACSVARFMGAESGLVAQLASAPQYPTADRLADAVILLRITTRAAVGDRIEVAGVKLKVVGISQNYDSVGKISNHIAEAVLWK